MNHFEIVYIFNPALNVNKVLRDQVEKFLKETFHSSTMSDIKCIEEGECARYFNSNVL